MGTLTPLIGTLTQTLGAVHTLGSTINTLSGQDRRNEKYQQQLAMQNLKQSQALEERQMQADADLQKQTLAEQNKQAEDARRKALKRAMAKQNARRGASGTSGQGSYEAVLLGLYNDAEDESANDSALNQIRYNAIDNDLYYGSQSSILERSQLAAKQRLEREIQIY